MPSKTLKKASYHFAVRIVKLAQKLRDGKNENVLSNEVLKSRTAIGALVRAAELESNSEEYSETLHLALKEAHRAIYWLDIIEDTGYILETIAYSLKSDCNKLIEGIDLEKASVSS
ncbi:four helix bundle protein [Opitutia bacterium ISCC 51]|nr:four helix bundle protein [Opitutae bacterium ISCC 51]QXD30011.1 four helix bundle protein [Opitutae bacterium ISCC 52]